jgi:phosphomannomutase
MIPWLLIVELMARRCMPLADLVNERTAAFPSSGETDYPVDDAHAAIARVIAACAPQALARDDTDGVSLDMGDWRFSLRSSGSGPVPVLRLNVAARGDAALVASSVARVSALIAPN